MSKELNLEKLSEFFNPKSKSNLLMVCFVILMIFKAIGLGWFFGGLFTYLFYKFKKKEINETLDNRLPNSYKEFKQKKGFGTSKLPIDTKLQQTVQLTQKKRSELMQKHLVLKQELQNLTVKSPHDLQYENALRSGLEIIEKQIAKVEESYAHLELSVYNKKYQELIKQVNDKKRGVNFNTVNKDLTNLLTRLQTDANKYNQQEHPRAMQEYQFLIEQIDEFRNRIEQVRRKQVLNDISMTGVYDEDLKNATSFDHLKDVFSNLDADKSIQTAMDELEQLEEEMRRLNAEGEVLKRYGDTL